MLLLSAAILAHAAVALALHLGGSPAPVLLALALALVLGAALALAGRAPGRLPLRLVVILLSAGLGLARTGPDATPPLDAPLVLSGIVTAIEREGPDSKAATLLLAEPALDAPEPLMLDRPLRARFDYLDPVPSVGAAIRFHARLTRARVPFNPSAVPRDEPPLFARAMTLPEPSARAPSWSTALAIAIRARLALPSESATALYRALLLGDRSELDPETRYAYQDTGTAHLLAISGMNLALLGVGLFRVLLFAFVRLGHTPILSRLGFARLAQGHRPRALAALIALGVTAAYTALIAPSDATDRALAALAITFGGIVLLRGASAARTLLLCLLGAAAVAPETLVHAGFQLSFAASASLVLIAPQVSRLRAALRARPLHPLVRHVLLFLAALVLADLACFLATAPLTVAWFGQLPLHGLWVNLVAIPFMSLVVFPAGVIWLLLAVTTPLGDALAPWLSSLGDAFNDLIRAAGDAAGSASTEAWPLALGVLASLSMLALLATGNRFPSPWPRRARRLGALGLMLASLIALVHESPRAGLSLTALDVGHGDALAVLLPDGTRMLVDTGGKRQARTSRDGNRQLAERVLVPALRAAGFASLDALVLTHADSDHVGAALALSERVPIRALWLPPCAGQAAPVKALARRLAALGTTVLEVSRARPFSYGGARFEILGPTPAIETPTGCKVKDNDASLVMRLGFAGRHLLLTGDVEAVTEAALLAGERDLLAADILKVPHHGSRTSSTDAFLDAVDPRVAIVSGLPGPHPPPHPAILARYRERGITTWVTGTDGAVTAHIDPDGALEVEGLRPP